MSPQQLVEQYIKSVSVGLLKVMAKMGVSTLMSYKGSQLFEALGLADDVVAACFKGTASRIAGVSFEALGAGGLLLLLAEAEALVAATWEPWPHWLWPPLLPVQRPSAGRTGGSAAWRDVLHAMLPWLAAGG
jgi:hypothetical protein